MERMRKLEATSHPPVDWEMKINELAKKVKKLEQLIIKGNKNAKS